MKIYHCDTCDQLLIKLLDHDNVLSCCGVVTEPLRGNAIEEERENHTPYIRKVGKFITISLHHHPQVDIHHIQFIGIETTEGVVYKPLGKNQKPTVDFVLSKDEELQNIFLYCNVHMLWTFPASDMQDS